MNDDPYLYPGTTTLRNKVGLRDAKALDRAERRLVAACIAGAVDPGQAADC